MAFDVLAVKYYVQVIAQQAGTGKGSLVIIIQAIRFLVYFGGMNIPRALIAGLNIVMLQVGILAYYDFGYIVYKYIRLAFDADIRLDNAYRCLCTHYEKMARL